MRPMVERSRHNKRKSEIQTKLRALLDFQMVFSGQNSSFRIQLAEQDLEDLGADPQVPPIVRPQVSELGQLQAEFNSILKTVVMRSPTPSALKQVHSAQATQVQEIRLLRANIFQAIARLSNSFHTYEDITKPLTAMLRGLDVGLGLALLAGALPTESDLSIRRLCATTPFLGAGPNEILNFRFLDAQEEHTLGLDHCSQYLKSFALARSASVDLEEASLQRMFQVFHKLYEQWKENLSHDQQQNAAKSSLYRYRGSETDSDEADLQDFQQLFPMYTDASGDNQIPLGAMYDPKEQARRLAGLHRQIFQGTETSSTQILNLLREASRMIVKSWQGSDKLSMSPVPSENLISAVILSLDEKETLLRDQAVDGNLYNFYTDANVPEAQKLITLVHRLQVRFKDLQEAWAEHATLDDVLRTSSELLSLRHAEPIAKLLTKTEQLHSYIHEWQVVASKEYCAAPLYAQLTDLLVSWRRLELSTWARLLDMEDQRCAEDADSWWFVAYESIIAAPLSLVDVGEELHRHSEQMFSILSNFLATTSMGQYSHRLGMIKCFESHLELLTKVIPSMSVVHNALKNFLSFYSRFTYPVQDSMRKGRQTLEKDMKEVLLLASWKDTNIVALRDSAKRSHHRLFKIVRKYRALLARPSETVLSQTFPDKLDNSGCPSATPSVIEVAAVDLRALKICQESVNGWEIRPQRFTNPSSTAHRMRQASQLPSDVVDGASYLNAYGMELIGSIKAMQKATPSKATKENAEAIKHLKARKRKLFAETLKDLRQMGFRSNVSANTLTKQESIPVTLTGSPAFAHSLLASEMCAAEYYFHKLLGIMPQLKERLRTHSEDLTNGEVARSLGYLESIMSVLLKQRIVLSTAMCDAAYLDKTIQKFKNVWAPDSYTVTKLAYSEVVSRKDVHTAVKWLPGILEAGSIIVQKYARIGESAVPPVIETLSQWKEKIEMSQRSISNLVDLPVGLSSTHHEKVLRNGERLLRDLKADLHILVESNPSLAFVFNQIPKWTDVNVILDKDDINGTGSPVLKLFEKSISSVSDTTLVAIQRMREACLSMPRSDEESAWLTRIDTSLSIALKGLHAKEVNAMLDDTMSKMCHLDSTEEDGLKVVGALCAVSMPIVDQYRSIHRSTLSRHVFFHESLCKLASCIAHSFWQIAKEGFCTPPEDGASEAESAQNIEGGTGLGDGEGAEDISKDIQEDEDLSELAQQRNKDDERNDIEDQEEAVDMDRDELEGEVGDVSDRGEDDGSGSENGEDDVEEETGDVDDLDPSAIDEKLWEGKTDDTEKQKQGSKTKGMADEDDQAADDSKEKRDDDLGAPEEDDDDISQEGAEEGEQVAREETENVDPHAQDGQHLDLPEKMDIDEADGPDAGSESGDDDIDALSDVEQEPADGESSQQEDEGDRDNALSDEPSSLQGQLDDEVQEETAAKGADEADFPVDTDPSDDGQEVDQGLPEGSSENAATDPANSAANETPGHGQAIQQQGDEEATTKGQSEISKGSDGDSPSRDATEAATQDEGLRDSTSQYQNNNTKDKLNSGEQSQAFKKLGNALEQWHRQQQQIQDASDHGADHEQATAKYDESDHNFEHLSNDEAEADTQAMGASTQEKSMGMDQTRLDLAMLGSDREAEKLNSEFASQEGTEDEDDVMRDYEAAINGYEHQQEQSQPSAFINNTAGQTRLEDKAETELIEADEEIEHLHNDLSLTHLQNTCDYSSRSVEEARQLWSHYEGTTRELSLVLTEQLRLILEPTLASKMRGDFRTGKRLNIKRIIPYIASQYKRDKIWMRRSVPSKRNYQIMLAVDDSKSMGESGSAQLAFESLALVFKSLSMLEAGEVAVVAFGEKVRLAHSFGNPLNAEAGAQIFQHFGFEQATTNVRKLVAESISLFSEARQRTPNAGTALWQLELIISDGICEDHEGIKRLVRKALELHVMIVFVIVNSPNATESITEMTQATFESDASGEMKLSIKRYLDGFPFPYYIIVGNVRELPVVLAQALRQWFSEVVERG
ncbi:midasin, partial [Lecanoromycetidae sp. Uapishka_2]